MTTTKPAPAKQSLTFEECLTYIPAREREAVLERAAIMEYQGNLPREQAELNALLDWKRRSGGKT